VKVFDFGLATEMVPSRKVEGMDTYMLTKDTGSPRYMAPEVFRGIPYNEKCDVYSFALILWSCLDLSLPFSNYDLPKMASKVYRGKETPKINSKWSEGLKTLLINCWLRDFSKRQSSMDVVLELKKEIGEIDGDLIGQLDISNRTEKSINNLRL
jgi:serine/threonine protein kinase